MSTYFSIHLHVVFATKFRQPTIAGEWESRLYAYFGGTLRNLEVAAEAIGGTSDHVHLLLGMRPKHAPAEVFRELKKSSSTWVKDTIGVRDFGWQEGYACISVSPADRLMIEGYIAKQKEHHQTVSALDELTKLLADSGVEYDPRFLA